MIRDSLTPDQLEVGKTYDFTWSFRRGDDVEFSEMRAGVVDTMGGDLITVKREDYAEPTKMFLNANSDRGGNYRLHSIKEVTS